MLSISKPIRRDGGDYYELLSRDDYYPEGAELPGVWHGRGCADFGISGAVQKEEFANLLNGYSRDGQEKLVQNAGKRNRQAGIDLTFSAPKSVSTAWSQADEKTRRLIEAAHSRAVQKALDYLEEVGGFTRIGKDGEEVIKASLAFAVYLHGTSRTQDPHLHSHAALVNACRRADGSTGTIITKPMFEHKMTAGALYRAELAAELEKELGLTAERDIGPKQERQFRSLFHKGGLFKQGTLAGWAYKMASEWHARISAERTALRSSTFELQGVSRELMKIFSQRREQIEAQLEKTGEQGAIAAQAACLKTRPKKEIVPREELFDRWQAIGREHGFSEREVAALLRGPKPIRDLALETTQAISRAVKRATSNEIGFSERGLIRLAAEEAQGVGVSGTTIVAAVRSYLSGGEAIRLHGANNPLFTTREMLETERSLFKMVDTSKKEPFRFDVGRKALEALTAKVLTTGHKLFGGLSDEQAKAVKHITQGKGTIRVVSGMAGTGKSTMLRAARRVWQKQGFKVIGAALAGKAAEGLFRESGIKSTTIAGLLASIEGGWTKLNKRSVVVIDEAGMIGTRTMARLVAETQKRGARLILVGDERQLQPIEAGSPFKAIGERLGQARLTQIRRQKEDWAKDAVHAFADGEAKEALAPYVEKGLVSVKQNRHQAKSALIRDWQKNGITRPEQHLILATTNAEVGELNRLAQDERLKAQAIRGASVEVNGVHVYKGERILFTRRSTQLGVENGSFATVLEVGKSSLVAKLDGGKTVTIPLKSYQDLQLGYAVTTHKAQGMTVDNALILLGGPMQDREITYVQASRARGETRFYVDRAEAGKDFSNITEKIHRTGRKYMALELLEKEGPDEPGDLMKHRHKIH